MYDIFSSVAQAKLAQKDYDIFSSIGQAKTAYRRKHRPRTFILKHINDNPDCVVCHKPIFDFTGLTEDGEEKHPPGYQSNLCDYIPRTKLVYARHYICAWESLLSSIINLRGI